ncbi:Polysaccharide pyruvyl transferase [[Clostridium] aminophilum]|uniref:Polysaccharide pyruvyl transferase n=1 Tax=[Clostridium] aminophilum TaxID=1526 RepID=A0A1I0B7T4_9FIRM|nr:polysaccharide pyruvyl transferase family protein [[Clostridium] aminophilum]SET02216.1 Polysaccharide pyruvyl transferase [[Clostridium] aminophilum]
MKISLITMHAVYNYGSALQTYATITALQRMGHEVEVINYFPKRMRQYGTIKQIYRDALPFHSKWKCLVIAFAKYPSMRELKKVFVPFSSTHFNMTRKYETNTELTTNVPIADCYCTGSDQVWNDYLEGEFDLAFFLNFAPEGSKRVALAASFGRDDISQDELLPVKKLLNRYSAISVREESGVEILKDVQIPIKECVLDPTFLLSFDDWTKFAVPIPETGYILVYQLHEDSIASEAAIAIGKRLNKQVIRISTDRLKRIRGGKTVFFPKVEEFVSYIFNADLIVTDSFHATAFSIILKKQFVSIEWKMFNDRIQTILRKTKLSDRSVGSVEEAVNISSKKIEFSEASRLIEIEKEKLQEFIITAF